MLKRLWGRLARQNNTGPHIGALINMYTSTSVLYSPLTFIGVATTVYGLWGADAIRHYLPWFSFVHLLGIMVVFNLIAMVFFYKVVIPSIYAFQVQQQYKHRNPLVADVLRLQQSIDERLDRLEKLVKDQEEQDKGKNKGKEGKSS